MRKDILNVSHSSACVLSESSDMSGNNKSDDESENSQNTFNFSLLCKLQKNKQIKDKSKQCADDKRKVIVYENQKLPLKERWLGTYEQLAMK